MRVSDLVVTLLVIGGLALAALQLGRRAEPLAGVARVVDGDTLRLAGRTIRLAGMDAPEMAQTCGVGGLQVACGRTARDRVVALIGTAPVDCAVRGRDKYGRDLGRCSVGGRDIGRMLVAEGLAVAYGDYASEERTAQAAGRGLWAGTFERPAAWRRAHPRAPRGAALLDDPD